MKSTDEQFEKAFRNVEASHLVEGLETPEGVKELLRQKTRGEISQQEYLNRLLEIAKR